MSETIQAVRGMNDGLPHLTTCWQRIEAACRVVANSYGYRELRTPVLEKTALYKRSIGDVTDIVEKEMYTFADRNGEMLSLRPEGTAGCVRAGIEHGLLYNQIQRLWYMGPMFRHERPQKGRLRQFHQFGIEAFGMSHAAIDAEIILLNQRLWQELGLAGQFTLLLNSLGTASCRSQHRTALIEYLQAHHAQLDADSQRRLHSNPLRILDSKNPDMAEIIAAAPRLQDYWCDSARQHFDSLCEYLDKTGVSFKLNPFLVRGLDYYTHTVFEWTTDKLGAQGTVSAGGRYDTLVTQLGGKKPVPAVGFAVGIERLLLLLSEQQTTGYQGIYMVVLDASTYHYALQAAEQLRQRFPKLLLEMDNSGSSPKSQFRRATQSQARWVLVCGTAEMAADSLTIKDLRAGEEQQQLSMADLIAFLQKSDDTLQQA